MADTWRGIGAPTRGSLALFARLAGARLRSDWQYRTSFALFTLSQALITSLEFVALVLLLEVTPTLGGWTRPEVALLYGLAALPFAISDVFVSAIDDVGIHVRQGTFDRLLLRPASTIVQILGDEFALRRIGKMIPATTVLAVAITQVDVDWTLGRIGIMVLAVVSGFGIYSGIWIASAATSFWTVDSSEALNAVSYGGQFASQYPLHLYRNWIRMVLGWVIPLAFIAYVPSVAILEPVNPLNVPGWLVYLNPLVALVVVLLALKLWRTGERRYQSTGS